MLENGGYDGFGNELDNVITAKFGPNVIGGGRGNDTLTGGEDGDTFQFDTALNSLNNVDRITDFNVVDDTIVLENSIFTGLTAGGVLVASAFHVGASAAAADDRIVYNSATGALIYDSNGNAAGGATQFAKLATGLALTNADFVVI